MLNYRWAAGLHKSWVGHGHTHVLVVYQDVSKLPTKVGKGVIFVYTKIFVSVCLVARRNEWWILPSQQYSKIFIRLIT